MSKFKDFGGRVGAGGGVDFMADYADDGVMGGEAAQVLDVLMIVQWIQIRLDSSTTATYGDVPKVVNLIFRLGRTCGTSLRLCLRERGPDSGTVAQSLSVCAGMGVIRLATCTMAFGDHGT